MKLKQIGGPQNDGLVRSDNGIIYVRKYREGHGEICKSTRTRDTSKARKIRDDLFAELWGDKPKKQLRKTIGELWPLWAEGKSGTKSKGTADSIKYSWRNLESYVADKFPDEITEDWWTTQYIPRRRSDPSLKDGKANPNYKFMNDRKWLLAFLNYLKRRGELAIVPNLINPDPARERAEVLKPGQFEKLLDAADWSLMAKLVMGRDHFMRRSEVALLEKAWINHEERSISLPAWVTKIRKARKFPYNESLEWLFLILDEQDQAAGIVSRFVFPSPSNPEVSIGRSGFKNAWAACKRKAGVSAKFKFHWLRHTGLTLAFNQPGVNVAKVCAAAGLDIHEAMQTYVHFTLDDLRGIENLVGGT